MPMGVLIPLMLLAIPILEIAVFIYVGGEIGVFPTLAMIFVTAVLGTILLRLQGFTLIAKIRGELEANRLPGRELAHGAMLLAAGILLLTPGFVTDAIGFLLFLPPVRDAISAFFASRIMDSFVVHDAGQHSNQHSDQYPGQYPGRHPGASADNSSPHGRTRPPDPGVVDLDPEDFERKPDPTSPWSGKDSDKD